MGDTQQKAEWILSWGWILVGTAEVLTLWITASWQPHLKGLSGSYRGMVFLKILTLCVTALRLLRAKDLRRFFVFVLGIGAQWNVLPYSVGICIVVAAF